MLGVAYAIRLFERDFLQRRVLVDALEGDLAALALVRVQHPTRQRGAVGRNDSHFDSAALNLRRRTTFVVDGLVEGVAAAYYFAVTAASGVEKCTKRGHIKKWLGLKNG